MTFRTSLIAFQDFYAELGLAKHATQDEIKKAYFLLAKKYHPDVNKTSQAKERFAHISAAYATLGDENKRRIYDATGMDGDEQGERGFGHQSGGGYGQGFAGYEEFQE